MTCIYRFVIAAGTMPSHSTLFDMKGSPLYQYGAAHRNTILWSPHGRFLCIAGFGNLAGEMDFYDTLRSKKLGSLIDISYYIDNLHKHYYDYVR